MRSVFKPSRTPSLQPRDPSFAATLAAPDPAVTARKEGGYQPPAPPKVPEEVLCWIAQLTLLYGVPFEYLVADQRLLPRESLRFFHLDRNWLHRAIDGALSTATLSTAEHIFNEALFEQIYASVEEYQQKMRPMLRNKPAPKTVVTPADYTGLLLRSVVVSGWPGLEVVPTLKGEPVDIIRMDRVSDTILLVIFAQEPDAVSLIEPSEGMHFGLIPDPNGAGWLVNLRGLSFGGFPAGAQIEVGQTRLTGKVTMRSGANQPKGVVDVATTAAELEKAMPTGALGPAGKLTAAGFALQMVRGAGKMNYTVAAELKCPPNGGGSKSGGTP